MQFQSILALLSIAITASAAPAAIPNPNTTPATCSSPTQVAACCDSFLTAVGLNCVQVLTVANAQCTNQNANACCTYSQSGVNINLLSCSPINVAA